METRSEVRFTVLGEPQGKARARTVKDPRTGKSRTYTPEKTVSYENLIKLEYQAQCRGNFFTRDIPVSVKVDCYLCPPKGRHPERPMKKPDWDNIGKIICDALNKVAWCDDAQVVEGTVAKHWAGEMAQPIVFVSIRRVDQ